MFRQSPNKAKKIDLPGSKVCFLVANLLSHIVSGRLTMIKLVRSVECKSATELDLHSTQIRFCYYGNRPEMISVDRAPKQSFARMSEIPSRFRIYRSQVS